MNRPLTALFAALEALLVVGIGVGIPLVPLTILWAVQYGLQIDWVVFWRASVDIWLLGNGGDLYVTLDPLTATTLGLPGASAPFLLSIAPLGFALLTVLFGVRAGRRIGETPHPIVGTVTALGVFVVLAAGLTLSALYPLARPSIWQGVLLPTVFFAVGIVTGLSRRVGGVERKSTRMSGLLRGWIARLPGALTLGFRGGAVAAAAVTAVAAVAVAVMMLTHYADMIALYESAHAGVLGGITLTIGQLAFLPNLVIWTSAWFVGPGFAIGAGSAVSPLGTSLGPLPTVPILGAIPTGDFAFGFIGLLVPLLVAFLVGIVIRSRVLRLTGGPSRPVSLVLAGVGVGIAGGVLLGLLAWASAGAAGPGRLVDVGPSPWLVGGFAALEFAIAAIVGLFAAGSTATRVE
ncbi:cell division protein PerM [Parafrigoribacterium soli]|uniref:cell division protein PerM n=1 Tax=Parafrigoribacterium soli TaxID=3144663 RepID=UPI0032EE41BC